MIDELILSFNKARQASITKEMIEITTSLEAMSA
jgi:F-type H+-transporting ATPase subunit gamma